MKTLPSIFKHFSSKKGTRMAAALAYYGFFALVPLVIIFIILLQILSQKIIEANVIETLSVLIGPQVAVFINTIINNQSFGTTSAGIIISVGLILFATFKALNELQTSLDTIFESPIREKGAPGQILQQMRNFSVLLVGGGLILSFTIMQTVVQNIISKTILISSSNEILILIIGYCVSFLVGVVAIAALFRIFPNVPPARSSLWRGAIITSLLLVLGQIGISLFLAQTDVASQYGAASTLAALLVWLYYTSIILFFGASTTHIISVKQKKKFLEKAKKETIKL